MSFGVLVAVWHWAHLCVQLAFRSSVPRSQDRTIAISPLLSCVRPAYHRAVVDIGIVRTLHLPFISCKMVSLSSMPMTKRRTLMRSYIVQDVLLRSNLEQSSLV